MVSRRLDFWHKSCWKRGSTRRGTISEWRPICFTLVVDDFGVKYVGEEHARHLLDAMKQYYKVADDLDTKK